MDTNNFAIGVFIGRLQIHELHEGHHYAIRQVVDNHKKTIIFLGVPKFIGTKKNPLDFDTRKKMVQTDYPDSIILSLPDNPSDKKWANELDRRIREVYPHGDVLMYGSRDSFIPFYIKSGGKFKTKEIEPLGTFAGTDVRKLISEEVKNSSDFRAGVIYHAYNLFPRVIPTVTIIPINNDKTKLLVGKKYDEDKYRFIGGFIKPEDISIKESVNRIYHKETGGYSNIVKYDYIDSLVLDDWRFRGEEDKVMSTIFSCDIDDGRIEPTDDIIEIKWVELSSISNILIDEHKPIVNYLK